MNMKSINFRQPKYIFPAVIFVPLCALIYFLMEAFGGGGGAEEEKDTGRLDLSLPEARSKPVRDKLYEMTHRYGEDREARSAVAGLGEAREAEGDTIDAGYTEEDLRRLDSAAAAREQEEKMEELRRGLEDGRRRAASYPVDDPESDAEAEEAARELEEARREGEILRQSIEAAMGTGEAEAREAEERHRRDSAARARREAAERGRPALVVKSPDSDADKFNTISDAAEAAERKLVRAMIDRTTKASDGTRLRFKLLDDVTVGGTRLKKGTYLYGTVTGFSSQRVKASVTSILAGDRFIKVDLAVYDNDGMEGFYVPTSNFREFSKDAAAGVLGQDIGLEPDEGYGGGISGEALALQNVYSSATGAVSRHIRRNKAKIKYNTVVYLINSDEAR